MSILISLLYGFLKYDLTRDIFPFQGSGYYIYIETSSPRRPNDTARLLSPTIPPDGRMGHCVKFWFHMYGPHVNALNVYKKVGNVLQLAWKRVGNNGNIWRYGQVTLNSNVRYQVWLFACYACYLDSILRSSMFATRLGGSSH